MQAHCKHAGESATHKLPAGDEILPLQPFHRHQALVLDAPWLKYIASNDKGNCSLFTVGESFESVNQALAFPSDFDDEALKTWSRCGLQRASQSV
jgi:hypothetical protein